MHPHLVRAIRAIVVITILVVIIAFLLDRYTGKGTYVPPRPSTSVSSN